MATEIRLPELGENIEQGDVVGVLVKVGDTIAKDQPILEVETGKAVVEVPATSAGTVKEIHVSKGDTVEVNTVVATVDGDGASAGDAGSNGSTPAAEDASDEKSGPAAPEGNVEPPREEKPAGRPAPPQKQVPAPAAGSAPPSSNGRGASIPAAPHVRRIARELGLDISQVRGTGKAGRISVEDLKAHSRDVNAGRAGSGVGGGVAAKSLPDFTSFGEVTVEDMSTIRRLTAEGLTHAHQVIPPVTQHDLADTTDVEAFRKQYQKAAGKQGAKITVTSILLKICARALAKFPQFNSSVDLANKRVVYKHYVNIGVAVDTPRGLLVPVIRDADRKGIIELSAELGEAAKRARDGKTRPEELQGGCFSISNLGGIGGTQFTPIVNWPEVAILGVSRGRMQPEWNGSEFVPRQMTPLSLTYDHRIIDGADAARFTRWIADALESPLSMDL